MIKDVYFLRFDVWIAGEPAPTIEWLRNDEKIVPDEKTSINVYSKNASVYTLKNVVLSIPKVNISSYVCVCVCMCMCEKRRILLNA